VLWLEVWNKSLAMHGEAWALYGRTLVDYLTRPGFNHNKVPATGLFLTVPPTKPDLRRPVPTDDNTTAIQSIKPYEFGLVTGQSSSTDVDIRPSWR